ncbi:tubulin polyglutamylase ttll6 [Anabrus simplex]|uniref:tubulin polyglutamylase ttll6 n=1 Tax=Anabrus simplex TaxID=316456 RepID=UPI0035A2D274
MNGDVCRNSPSICTNSSTSLLSLSSSDSEIDGELDECADEETVDKVLTLVDEFNNRNCGKREQCTTAENYYTYGGETDGEGEEERDDNDGKESTGHLRKQQVPHYIPLLSPNKPNKSDPLIPAGEVKRKKKKRKKKLSICTVNCRYEVVRHVATKFGMKEVGEDEHWNLYWTDLSVTNERLKDMKRFQKINHFPGMLEICRKDLLARNLNRMRKLFPKDYNFFPKTWCLPADYGDALTYARSKRNRTYICKPETGCQGRGIFLTRSLKDLKPFDRLICQVYLAKPFLIDGFKFDLRIYVLMTSCDPLRIFVYNDGLVRFATSRYREPTQTNTSNVFMHLTNYAVNKHSRTYILDDEAGSKRKISTLNKWLEKKNYNIKDIWASIDDVIIKTIIAAHPTLKHNYHACFPSHNIANACFELLGFDILLDHRLKPFILEVNHSPSFHTDAQIDKEIKECLLMDTFEILNFCHPDKKKILVEDRRKVRERLLQGLPKDSSSDTPSAQTSEKTLQENIRIQESWEETHLGNYRCIYPMHGSNKYAELFNQTQSSLFQETAASRAREECARLQRVELESKAKLEAAKRPVGKVKELERLQPESPPSKEPIKKPLQTKKSLLPQPLPSPPPPPPPPPPPLALKRGIREIKSCSLPCYDPEPILEAEERDRMTGLAQRDFLIRSNGLLEQIYHIMQKTGTLRPGDERKYGTLARTNFVQKISPVFGTNKLPAVFSSYSSRHSTLTRPKRNLGLSITCNNAPIFSRPNIPRAVWVDDIRDRDVRITKAHVARTYTNSVKLQEIERREHRQLHNEG